MSCEEHINLRCWVRPITERPARFSIYLFAAGRRSGDQFCAYVCDRLVVPDLTTEKAGCATRR